jgi:hypothetical protein
LEVRGSKVGKGSSRKAWDALVRVDRDLKARGEKAAPRPRFQRRTWGTLRVLLLWRRRYKCKNPPSKAEDGARGHEANTVEWAGFKAKKNGDLLKAAEIAGYMVLLTVDGGPQDMAALTTYEEGRKAGARLPHSKAALALGAYSMQIPPAAKWPFSCCLRHRIKWKTCCHSSRTS